MITFLIGLLTVVEVVTAVLLIGIILIQESKAGGGLGAMSGGVTESVFGASAGNVLTRATVILGTVFLVNTLTLNVLTGHRRPGMSVAETVAPASETRPAEEAKKPKEAPSEAGKEAASPAESEDSGVAQEAKQKPAAPAPAKPADSEKKDASKN